jgi:hypothetical protein
MTGNNTRKRLSLATRRELTEAIAARYRAAKRDEKQKILDEFVEVTGFHRKHAIRVLRRKKSDSAGTATRSRLYDAAVVEALTILWEASDRICGKRLKPAIPALLDAMERHGHLALAPEVRERVMSASAATIDRLLAPIRNEGRQGRRRTTINTPRRKMIAVRTFADWNDPPPGFFEMDMVAHCGKSVAGSHVHSLVLTDIASGWTEACGLVMREQTLITVKIDEVRARLPFAMLGLDVDNDSAFINETLVEFCKDREIELTRSRAYKKKRSGGSLAVSIRSEAESVAQGGFGRSPAPKSETATIRSCGWPEPRRSNLRSQASANWSAVQAFVRHRRSCQLAG